MSRSEGIGVRLQGRAGGAVSGAPSICEREKERVIAKVPHWQAGLCVVDPERHSTLGSLQPRSRGRERQQRNLRDHRNRAKSSTGANDDFVAGRPGHPNDLDATILHCLGIDHKRFTYKLQGLEEQRPGEQSAVATKSLYPSKRQTSLSAATSQGRSTSSAGPICQAKVSCSVINR